MNRHAIIVIKNKDNEYLQYFDKRWSSPLFPNCKLEEKFTNNTIIEYIERILKIDKSYVECTYIGEKIHTKFSESAKQMKEYDHFIFSIKIIEMSEIMRQGTFYINGLNYKWYSYNELINDERIQEVNGDIVGFIKEWNL